MHLVIDAIPRHLLTKEDVSRYLSQMPGEIGMTIIHGPIVTEQKEGAIIGIVIIAESHLSVHATPKVVFVDIFSCKPYDIAYARQFTLDALSLTQLESQYIKRLIPREA